MGSAERKHDISRAVVSMQLSLASETIAEMTGETGTSSIFGPTLESWTRLNLLKREGIITKEQERDREKIFDLLKSSFGPATSTVLYTWELRAERRLRMKMVTGGSAPNEKSSGS